jgi:hypothetical protein
MYKQVTQKKETVKALTNLKLVPKTIKEDYLWYILLSSYQHSQTYRTFCSVQLSYRTNTLRTHKFT